MGEKERHQVNFREIKRKYVNNRKEEKFYDFETRQERGNEKFERKEKRESE